MFLLGGALGLFQLPLIIGVQSTVGWEERGTTTASVLFCRQTGQTIGATLFGAIANGVLAARLGGAGDLDAVTRALDSGAPAEHVRHAVADAVHAVYLGAAGAAALAFLSCCSWHRGAFLSSRIPGTEETLPPWVAGPEWNCR